MKLMDVWLRANRKNKLPVVESTNETGMLVYPSSQSDKMKLLKFFNTSDYYGEYFRDGNYFFVPESRSGMDALERELDKAFIKLKISARFESQ